MDLDSLLFIICFYQRFATLQLTKIGDMTSRSVVQFNYDR